MPGHQIRLVYRILTVGFLLIPNLCALLMARSSSSMAREVTSLEKALAFSCVAYHTRVSQSEERRSKGPDGLGINLLFRKLAKKEG